MSNDVESMAKNKTQLTDIIEEGNYLMAWKGCIRGIIDTKRIQPPSLQVWQCQSRSVLKRTPYLQIC